MGGGATGFSGGGSDGFDAVLAARQRDGSDTAVAIFDVLQLDGQDVMAEPWIDRRKRLEDVFAAGMTEPRLQLVPVSDDAARLWTVWVVEWGGELDRAQGSAVDLQTWRPLPVLVEGEE